MQIKVLRSKIHKAKVTDCQLHYDGSCAIDRDLLNMSGIHEFEQIHIYNITNGERFVTYAIRAEEDDSSMTISLRGAAARKAEIGDEIIICAYGEIEETQMENFKPIVVFGNLFTE